MRRILKCLVIAAMFSGPLHAGEVAVDTEVYVEHRTQNSRTIASSPTLRRGDRVVTLLNWQSDDRTPVTMTTRVPRDLSFLDASADEVEISTDGGRNWHASDANAPGQVTHIRWRSAPASGRMTYSAIVR